MAPRKIRVVLNVQQIQRARFGNTSSLERIQRVRFQRFHCIIIN